MIGVMLAVTRNVHHRRVQVAATRVAPSLRPDMFGRDRSRTFLDTIVPLALIWARAATDVARVFVASSTRADAREGEWQAVEVRQRAVHFE